MHALSRIVALSALLTSVLSTATALAQVPGPTSTEPTSTGPVVEASEKGFTLRSQGGDFQLHLRGQLHELRDQLTNLFAEKKKLSTTGVSNFGTSATVKPSAPSTASTSTADLPWRVR